MPTPTDPNQAQAWISGVAPDQTIDFYIPRGNQGLVGPRGPIGPSVIVGSIETNMGPAAPGTVGPQGLPGAKGDPGGITLGTILYGANLNTITADGIYRQTDSGGNGANSTLNYPTVGYNGILTVHTTQGTDLMQEWAPQSWDGSVDVRMIYRRNRSNNVWTSWRVFASSRVDQTAGRAIYEWDNLNQRDQLIYGDTGYRDISTSITDYASGEMLLRRVGSLCSVIFSGLEFTNVSGTLVHSYGGLIPAGFQSARSIRLPLSPSPGQVTTYGASGVFEILKGMEGPVYGEIMWTTFNPWPTTLPGTASGTIPNT